MSDIVFQEGTLTDESYVKVSESSYFDQDEMVAYIQVLFSYEGTIEEGMSADYLDINGEYIVQNGRIKTVTEIAADPVTGKKIYKVNLYNAGYTFFDYNINEVYRNVTAEELIQTIVEYCGLTFVNELPSASGITISKIVFQDFHPLDAIKPYIDALGANWRIEGTNFILFRNGTETLSNVSIDAFTGWIVPEGWKVDTTNQATKVIVRGANIQQRTTETLTGTGTVFYTSYQPENVFIDGLTQTTPTINGDYEVDQQDKKITFDTSKTDPVVSYSYNSQIRVVVGTGSIVKVLNKVYVESTSDARKIGRDYLNIYSDGMDTAIWETNKFKDYNILDFKRGFKINIFNKMNPEKDGPYVITKIQRDYPRGIKITVGEDVYNIFDWQSESKDRIKQLEQQTNNYEFVIEDLYQTGTGTIKVTGRISSLYIVLDDGKVLFGSETPLDSDGDLISDTGDDADYAIAYDDSAVPESSKIVIV